MDKDKAIQLGREYWKRLKGNRAYAATPEVETGIGGTCGCLA